MARRKRHKWAFVLSGQSAIALTRLSMTLVVKKHAETQKSELTSNVSWCETSAFPQARMRLFLMANASPSIIVLAANIVSAHCSNNLVEASVLPGLIQQVHQALLTLGKPEDPADKPVPAVPIKRSVFPDYIVCLEDGKKLKMLKRHLFSFYSMSPTQYRERWGLPPEYPMTAPNYAERRSILAKKIALGRKGEN